MPISFQSSLNQRDSEAFDFYTLLPYLPPSSLYLRTNAPERYALGLLYYS
jgi:hypothetical protein